MLQAKYWRLESLGEWVYIGASDSLATLALDKFVHYIALHKFISLSLEIGYEPPVS